MADILDYIAWRGDLSFDERPFNEVDALILCQVTYLDFSGIVPPSFNARGIKLRDASARFRMAGDYADRADISGVINPLTLDLLQAAGESRRFGELCVSGFENRVDAEKEEQFAAMVYTFPGKKGFVAQNDVNIVIFRGTDDTLVGWKEDFNLGFMSTVPSQHDALDYLTRAASFFKGGFIIGGHSKGGNLSLYASVNSEQAVRKRILAIYNNDGPGFDKTFFDKAEYKELAGREHTFVPELSVVGMLFSHADSYRTVECDQRGMMQHDPFSWHVKAQNFAELDDVNGESHFIEQTVNQWISALSNTQKKQFVETIFFILKKSEALEGNGISPGKAESAFKMLKAAGSLDPETRDAVLKTLQALFKYAMNNVGVLMKK